MTRSGRHGLAVLGIFLLLCGAAIVWLRSTRGAADLCTLARRNLPELIGLDVGIGRCELDPLTQSVTLHGLSLFQPGAEQPLLAADRAEVRLGAIHPIFGWVELEQIRVVRPRVNLDLTQSSSEPKTSSGCSLDALERLEIARLDVRNAEIRLRLPGDRWLEVLGGDVTWRRKRGRADVRIWAQRGRLAPRPGAELELSTIRVDARFDKDNERLEVSRAEVALDGLTFGGSGTLEGLCDPELTLEGNLFVPMSTVAHASGMQLPVDGHVWARLGVTGKAAQPVVTAEVAGGDIRIGRYTPGSFQARLALEGQTLRIDHFETDAGAGRVSATGALLLGPGLPLTAEVDIEEAQFGAILARAGLLGSWVDFPSTGKVRARGNLLPSPDLRAQLELRTGSFVLATRAWDAPPVAGRMILEFQRAHITGGARVLRDRVEFEGMRIDGPSSKLTADATLHYDPSLGMSIRGEASLLDLDDFGHIAGIEWSGTGTGSYKIAGPYSDPTITAAMAMRDLEFWRFSLGVLQGRLEFEDNVLSFPTASGQKGRTQYHGSGALDFGGGQLITKAEAQIDRGRTEDLVELLLPMDENVEIFQGTLDGDVSGTVEIHGPAETFEGTIDLRLANTRYYGRRIGDGRAVLRFVDGEKMVLERSVLKGPLGTTTVDGTWGFEGPLDYRFRVDGGSLMEVVGPERSQQMGLDASLTLVGKVMGDTDLPVVTAYLVSPEVQFADRKLGNTQLEARLQGRELQVWGQLFEGARANLGLTVKEPYPWSGSASLTLPEIRPFLPEGAVSQGVSGSIRGRIEGSGNLRHLRETDATARIERFALARRDFSAANDGPVDLTWKDGALRVENFVLRGPNTYLSVAGSAGPRALDLDLHGNFDLRLLESFVPQLERSSGRVEVTAAAEGTLEKPSVAGSAEFSDARTGLRDLPISLRGLSGRVEFSEARLLVQDVHGILNEGRVALRGDVLLERFEPRRLDISLQLDEVSARLVDHLPLTTSGELLLTGPPDALVLSGAIDIVKLRYEQPLQIDSLLPDLQSARDRAIGADEGPRREWLSFDVGVNANGDVRIDNNLARARLRGDLRLTGTNLHPGLLGSLESLEGSQIFFRGNQFAVSQAIVEFKDRRDIDPVFDLRAETQVREYLVNLHAFGRMEDPQMLLSADPDLVEADILSLLAFGVTSRDQNNAMANASLIGEAVFSASGLDRQIQRFLPRNPLLQDLSFHVSSSYNEASGFVEPTAQLESRFLTERLQLQMSQPVMTNKGTRAQAEYRFHDRLSGQLQWDNKSSNDVPNLGVDLKLRWEVE
ncbi:MAG: translocation/assembly module TamB [Myxococcaceae bacterium]